MGVDFSKEAARPPLSVACVAEISQVDPDQFRAFYKAIQRARGPIQRRMSLRNVLEPSAAAAAATATATVAAVETNAATTADSSGAFAAWRAYDLTAAGFEHALALSELTPHDITVLSRIFTIMDRSGDEVVHSLELLVATALLVHGAFATKLKFAVGCLLDDLHDKPFAPLHVLFLVSTMTTVANYFGDPLLPLPVLEGIADDVFQELSCRTPELDKADRSARHATKLALVDALAKHPYVQEYISQDRSAWSPR